MDYNINQESYSTPQLGAMQNVGSRKVLNMFFVVDVSGSMRYDGRMDAVNMAFDQMIPALRNVQESSSDFELRIAIMTFDEDARWIVPPTPIMEYVHSEIQCSPWVTFFSNAFKTMNEKLRRSEYMAHGGKLARPYIMFMTDGEPTKEDNYGPALAELNANGWFSAAQRFAVLIGPEAVNSQAAKDTVAQFVSNPKEGIITALDAISIVNEVQACTMRTIQIATQHMMPDAFGGNPNGPMGMNGMNQQMPPQNNDSGDVFGGFDDFTDFDDFDFDDTSKFF